MALSKCIDCRKRISEHAAVCPFCNGPQIQPGDESSASFRDQAKLHALERIADSLEDIEKHLSAITASLTKKKY